MSPRLATKAAALVTTSDTSLRPPPAAFHFSVCCACSGPDLAHNVSSLQRTRIVRILGLADVVGVLAALPVMTLVV
jgi:hypothetical protein